ncbi:MAG: hypothetical protein JMDDDDMK_00281 [Acidobacteria bacterium]|nr:hypothetical protein [Acidobacteriota bacterium]
MLSRWLLQSALWSLLVYRVCPQSMRRVGVGAGIAAMTAGMTAVTAAMIAGIGGGIGGTIDGIAGMIVGITSKSRRAFVMG